MIVYRFGASLFFENAAHFDARVRDLVANAELPVTAVVVDLAAMDDIDFTGAGVVRRLAEDFTSRGIRVYLTEMSASTVAAVDASGLPAVLTCVPRIEDAVRQAASVPSGDM